MLDIKKVRANFDEVKEKLSKRGEDISQISINSKVLMINAEN